MDLCARLRKGTRSFATCLLSPVFGELKRRVTIGSRAAPIVRTGYAPPEAPLWPPLAQVARVADDVSARRPVIVHAPIRVRPHKRGRHQMRGGDDGDVVAVLTGGVPHL